MRVRATLHAALRRYLPADADGNTATVELTDGATAAGLLAALQIPPGYTNMIVAEGVQIELDAPLRDGQAVQLFPPLAG